VIPRRVNGKGRARLGKSRRCRKNFRGIIGLEKICKNWQLSDKDSENVLKDDANFHLSGNRTLRRPFVAAHNILIKKTLLTLFPPMATVTIKLIDCSIAVIPEPETSPR